MNRKEPAEQAVDYFSQSYLCSQALFLAYAPQLGIKPEMAAKIAAPFGAGIGRLGGTCGAVSGALMVLGAKHGHETASDEKAKELVFEMARQILARFEAQHGTIVCRELLGRDISDAQELELAREEGLFETACPRFVRAAAEIVGEIADLS